MGDGRPKANFVVVDILNKKIQLKITLVETYDVLPKNLMFPNEQRLNMYHDTQKKRFSKIKILYGKQEKFTLVILIIFGLFLMLIFKLYKKNE